MTLLTDLKIAVLCGGVGAEREISLISGDAVAQALSQTSNNIQKIELTGVESEIADLRCDVAFLALHGEFGEDGTAQTFLEKHGVLYTGSNPQVSALAMNKNATKEKLSAHNLPLANGICVTRAETLDEIKKLLAEKKLTLPLVVKPNNCGSSVGVSMVRAENEFAAALNNAFILTENVLIEEYVDGRELTVGLLNGKALPIVEMATKKGLYDYQAKYFEDSTEYFCPAKLTDAQTQMVQNYAVQAWNVLGLRDLSRIDFMLAENRAVILEANTLPGFTPHSLLPKAAASAGINFAELCWEIVGLAIKRAKEQL